MSKLRNFCIIYIWALIDALLISWFLLPHVKVFLTYSIPEKYMKLMIPFIMISLVMPLVYWIQVPFSLRLCFGEYEE